MITKPPIYQHDCESCSFLGSMTSGECEYDLYYANHGGIPDTVIARFGNDGCEYSSGMIFADGTSVVLTEARDRAVKAGLNPSPPRGTK